MTRHDHIAFSRRCGGHYIPLDVDFLQLCFIISPTRAGTARKKEGGGTGINDFFLKMISFS